MRSLMRIRCGDVYSAVFNPEARKIDASVAAVDPFPLVPAINTLGKARSGCCIAPSSTRICSRSNLCEGVCASSWPSANMRETAVSYVEKLSGIGNGSQLSAVSLKPQITSLGLAAEDAEAILRLRVGFFRRK